MDTTIHTAEAIRTTFHLVPSQRVDDIGAAGEDNEFATLAEARRAARDLNEICRPDGWRWICLEIAATSAKVVKKTMHR